jgi:hypothetical protein
VITDAAAPDAAPLEELAASTTDAGEWTYHHRVLYRLVVGTVSSHTAELQRLYEAIAPLAYQGAAETPVERRWRRKLLEDLRTAGVLEARKTPHGWLWIAASENGEGLREDDLRR